MTKIQNLAAQIFAPVPNWEASKEAQLVRQIFAPVPNWEPTTEGAAQ